MNSSHSASWEEGTRLEMVGWEPKGRTIQGMAIDSSRRFLYLLETVSGHGLAIEQFALIGSAEIRSAIGSLSPLNKFPPGLVPIMIEYAGHWAKPNWQRFALLDTDDTESPTGQVAWEKALVDECHTGDVIGAFTTRPTFIRVTPSGDLHVMRHEDEDWNYPLIAPTFWSVTPTGICQMSDGLHMYQVEWNPEYKTYRPRLCGNLALLPEGTRWFVMDTQYIYTNEGPCIRQTPCDSDKKDRIVYESEDLDFYLEWCGSRHIFFSTTDNRQCSICVLPLEPTTGVPRCVVRNIELESDESRYTTVDSCLWTSHVVVRHHADFRLFPLHLE